MLDITRNILAGCAVANGVRLDGDSLDTLTAKYLVHQAQVFGTDRLDAEELALAAEYLADKSEVTKLDAGETLIVQAAGMLETRISPQTVIRPPTKARMLMTVTHEVARGSDSWSYEMYDHTGMADLVADYSDDLSNVSTNAVTVDGKVLTFGKQFDLTWKDMQRAAKTGEAIRSRKAAAVVESFDRRADRVGALGHPGTVVTGMLNNANIAVINAAAAAAGANAPQWDGVDKVAAEIVADAVAMCDAVSDNSKGVHEADTLILPRKHRRLIKQTRLYATGAAGDNPTIEEEIKRLTGIQNIEWWNFCDTADAAGTGERGMAYDSRFAPELEIPTEPEDLPPQAKSLSVIVPTLAELAGVRVRYPLAAVYMDSL